MARIKKFGDTSLQNLTTFSTFVTDVNPNSDYFRITEFKDTFTGGKNGFLIEGSEYLMESTEIKIEILDVEGNPMYYEPGDGIPEYYEGISKVVAVYVYEDTPIGLAKITILGELKRFIDTDGIVRDIPDEWKGLYNVKWEREFKVNKLLSNEDKVRFYRRPSVTIDEISRPIFSATPTLIQQTGTLSGTPLVPVAGTPLAGFSLPTSYLLTISDTTNWSGSVLNGTITIPNLGVTLQPSDVLTNKQLVVSTPYVSGGLVTAFGNQPYTASFNYLDESAGLGTALSGSFAKIKLTDLTTFVGDVARVKVFRKSQSEVSDFQFVQEIPLESNEILVDLESSQRNQEVYGLLTPSILQNYWVSSSNNLSTTFNQNFLYNSVKLDSNGTNKFYTSKSIDISTDVEYTLDLNLRLAQNLSSENYVRAFISGSKNGIQIEQNIVTLNSSNPYLQKTNITENFIGQTFDGQVKLYFEVKGNGWYLADISLRASQETSFSPDEITFIQPVPRNLASETFDFRFEFYDINNNYIPVLVEATKTFNQGNLNVINKNITLVPTSLYFQFDSGSGTGNPLPPTAIFIDVVKEFLTGSTNFTSRSFDIDNNELSASQYVGGQYPGLLIDEGDDLFRLTVENFTGSRALALPEIVVQYVEYTAECEGVSDTIVITRVSDGKGGVNYEIRPYNGTVIRNSDPSSSLEVQAIRIDGINEVNLQSGLPLGKSDYKLFVQSGSTYITLTEASAKGFVLGLSAGVTGSGQLDYNARFNRDSINGQRTVYLIPSSSNNYSASILTSLTLTDLQDGLDAGVVLFDADVFAVNPSPKLPTDGNRFIPTFSSATASFYKRGTFDSPISCSIEVYPSMSLNNDFVAEYWINYITHSCDPNISIVAFDEFGNVIPSKLNAATYVEGLPNNQNRQLITSFTYTEPWTSASVNVDKLFTIVPDGLVAEEPITFEVNPSTVIIKANENGDPSDFTPSITSVRVKQGNTYLNYDSAGANGSKEKDGTYYLNVNSDGIVTPGSFAVNPSDSTEVIVQAASTFTEALGTLQYEFTYQPYYTSSILNSFVTQSFTKVSNGRAARNVTLAATTNAVTYDGDNVIIDPQGDITLTATAYNTTGSAFFQFFKDGIELTPPTSIVFGGDTYTLSSGDIPPAGTTSVYKVTLRDGSGDLGAEIFAEAETTITATKSGTNAYNVSLTNENSSIFVDVYSTITFDNTGTKILATKGGNPLTAVTTYSASQFDPLGTEIPNGQYRVTLFSTSSHITPAAGITLGSVIPTVGGEAVIGDLTNWEYLRDPNTLLPLSASAEIVYQIDVENSKAVFFKTQSFTVQYEGAIGPGLVMRGEWTGSIDYIFDVPAKRRDAVFREISGNVHYWGTTSTLFKNVSPPYTIQPIYNVGSPPQSGDIDANGWQYLGQEDFFVAAKLAIFEESFVKNTINVGNNGGADAFANIVLAGGRIDPYIAVGQTGTAGASGDQTSAGVIGYGNAGIFLGTKVTGSSVKTPMMSLVNSGNTRYMRWDGSQLELSGKLVAGNMLLGPDVQGTNDGLYINSNNYWYDSGDLRVGNSTNYLEWDGSQLLIVGSVRQVSPGIPEGSFRGAWASGVAYYEDDVVTYNGASYICLTNHTSTNGTGNTGFPNQSAYWTVYAAAGTSGTSGADGPQGPSGAGIVFRGAFSSTNTYFYTTTRRDVVKASNNQFYLANNLAKSGLATWGDPTSSADWTSFGAQFSSVATDVLFSQDVYSDRTVNVGSSGSTTVVAINADYPTNANPYISIGQGVSQGYDNNGIFLGFSSSTPRVSLRNSTSGKFFRWDGSNLSINAGNFVLDTNGTLSALNANLSGFISASAGNIGRWTIESTGFLIGSSSQGQIFLDPNLPVIRFKNQTGNEKLIIKNGANVDPASAPTKTISIAAISVPTSNAQSTTYIASGTTSTTNITISAGEEGSYYATPDFSSFTQTGITYSSGFVGNGYVDVRAIIKRNGETISSLYVGSVNVYYTGGSAGSKAYTGGNFRQYINFPVAGTYTIQTEYEAVIFVEAGTATVSAVTSPAANNVSFTKEVELSEITDEGMVLSAGASSYIKLQRLVTTKIKLVGLVDFEGPNAVDTDFNYCRATWHPFTGNTYDLGSSGNRWKTIYTNNAVQVSDIRLKNSIEDIDVGLDFINSLKPKKFKYNDRKTPRYYYGLIAQEVTSSLSDFGMTTNDNSLIVSSSCKWSDEEIEGFKTGSNWESMEREIIARKEGYMNLNYTELIGPMIKAIQQLTEKVKNLELIISGSNL